MKTQKSLLGLFIASTLTACGGSDNSSTTKDPIPAPVIDPIIETNSFSGNVADGYLVGATMCLDENKNKECDADEPQTTSTAGGEFAFEGVTQTQIDSSPLLAEIISDITEDEDNPGVPLTKAYTLSAPAGYTFISPLTTLVQNEIDKGSTLEEAEQLIQDKLGTTLDLNADYIAGGADDSDPATQAEFIRLHQIAQVICKIIANNMAALETAAVSEGISTDELLSLIADKILDSLADIVEQVENTGDFDPDAIAATIDLGIAADTLAAQVAINQAENSAVVTDLFTVMQTDSLNWFWGQTNGQEFELEYGTLSIDSEGNAQGTLYSWENGNWLEEDASITSVTLNDDQSVTVDYTAPSTPDAVVTATEFELEGLNIALIMRDTEGRDAWAERIVTDAAFPESAIAYDLNYTSVGTLEESSDLLFNSTAREAILENFIAPEIVPTIIPTATVDVNGNIDDWSGVEVMLEDAADDAGIGGLDLTAIYLAQDTDNLYLRLDRASLDFPDGAYYNYWIYFESDSESFAVELYHDSDGIVHPKLWDTTAGVASGERIELKVLSGDVNISSQHIEVAAPKSYINTDLEYSLSFITHYTETANISDRDEANDDTGELETPVIF